VDFVLKKAFEFKYKTLQFVIARKLIRNLNSGSIGIILFFTSFVSLNAQEYLLTPQPSTAEEDSLVKIGKALHDKGKYEEAIEIFESILDDNPSNMKAVYEISNSCLADKDYDSAIEYSYKGVRFISEYRPIFYLNLGIGLNSTDEFEKAIEVLRKGMEFEPTYYLFSYNLGLSYYGLKNVDSARVCFHTSLKLNPLHAGSNLALANLYDFMNKNVPAVLAFARFLLLEPHSERSPDAFEIMQELISESVKVSSKANITVMPDSDAVDGDLRSLEVSLGLVHATRYSNTAEEKSEVQWLVYEFEKFFALMNNLNENNDYPGFVWNYYVPYYSELFRKGFTETFVHLILLCTNISEVKTWIADNAESVNGFIEWNKNYKWEK
jgi:tetratricopeptide (TPR) repeat protein